MSWDPPLTVGACNAMGWHLGARKGGGKGWQAVLAKSLKQEVEDLKWMDLEKYSGKGQQTKALQRKVGGEQQRKGERQRQSGVLALPQLQVRKELNNGKPFLNHPGRCECYLCLAPKVV